MRAWCILLLVAVGCGPVPLANEYVDLHAVAINAAASRTVEAVSHALPPLVESVRAVAAADPEQASTLAEGAVLGACDLAESVLASSDEVRHRAAKQQEWTQVTRTMVGPSKQAPSADPAQEDMHLASARLQAEVISRMRSAVKKAVASKIPFLSSVVPKKDGWTPGGIAGMVASLTAAAGALGLGAKKVNGIRKDRDRARTTANDYHDAMGAVVDAARSGKADLKAIDKIMAEHAAAKALHARRKAEEVEAGVGSG